MAVLDHANKMGKKILMSGGGRCNFTNLDIKPSHYLSANPHFCKSALSRFTQYDFIALVEQHGISYYEKTQGQLFCTHKAKDILQMLETLCQQHGVTLLTHCHINHIDRQDTFICHTSQGLFGCAALVIATGGKSIPTLGATGFGYDIARQFGLAVTSLDASLVPFVLTGGEQEWLAELAGVSCQAKVSCGHTDFTDALLFTHRGLSGPAILQISNYWHLGDTLEVNLLPGVNLTELIPQWRAANNRQSIKNALGDYLPKRLLETWLASQGNKSVVDMSNTDIETIAQRLHQWRFQPAGTEGYRTAEVTRGGVCTREISSKTFESTKQPGLYFIGEVLDVTGHLGGYNFQWAWASGFCAGSHV